MHFLAHLGNVKKQLKQIGSKKSALLCLFDRGCGGLKLFGQYPYDVVQVQPYFSVPKTSDFPRVVKMVLN